MSYTADATNVNTPADTDLAEYAAAELRAIKVVQVDHTSKINTNTGNISTNTTSISNLTTRVSNNETNISNVTTTANNAVQKTDLASNLAGKGAGLVGLQDSGGYFTTKTAEAALQQLASQQNTDKGNITSLQNSRTANESNISTLQSQMTTANNNITSLQNSRTTDESNISTLQNQMGTANTNITNLQNKQTSDEAFLVPQYGIIMWWKASIPSGWGICDGTNGTPDLRGRFILGASATHALGTTGGEETHVLTINEMPGHNHGITDPGHYHSSVKDNGVGGASGGSGDFVTGANTGTSTTGITINNTGGGAAHNNMPPYYALYFIMKL